MLPKEKWSKILVISAYLFLVACIFYLFFGRLLSLFLPFLLALALGSILQSPADSLQKRLRLPRKLVGFILVLVVIFFLGFVVFLLANRLVSEAQRLFDKLSKNSENIILYASELMGRIEENFPFIYEHLDRDAVNATVTEVVKNSVASLSSYLAATLTSFVKGLPDIALFFTVFVIASFYFAMDFGNLSQSISKLIPKRARDILASLSLRMKNTGMGYLKAYSVIMLITFAQLFAGFLLLKLNYATTLAILISLLDMLPVIGTATVLVPWALISLIMGNYPLGTGLLILLGVITITREVIEPKIIGSSIGMHPLLTLVAMYVGYKLFGIWGILLLPPFINLALRVATDKIQN